MIVCSVCGTRTAVQKCHVKDKATFSSCDNHDFHNIIYLCPTHHYSYFDKGRMVIYRPRSVLLLLESISPRSIVSIRSKNRIVVRAEYIQWKNNCAHMFLKAELRKLENKSTAT